MRLILHSDLDLRALDMGGPLGSSAKHGYIHLYGDSTVLAFYRTTGAGGQLAPKQVNGLRRVNS